MCERRRSLNGDSEVGPGAEANGLGVGVVDVGAAVAEKEAVMGAVVRLAECDVVCSFHNLLRLVRVAICKRLCLLMFT